MKGSRLTLQLAQPLAGPPHVRRARQWRCLAPYGETRLACLVVDLAGVSLKQARELRNEARRAKAPAVLTRQVHDEGAGQRPTPCSRLGAPYCGS